MSCQNNQLLEILFSNPIIQVKYHAFRLSNKSQTDKYHNNSGLLIQFPKYLIFHPIKSMCVSKNTTQEWRVKLFTNLILVLNFLPFQGCFCHSCKINLSYFPPLIFWHVWINASPCSETFVPWGPVQMLWMHQMLCIGPPLRGVRVALVMVQVNTNDACSSRGKWHINHEKLLYALAVSHRIVLNLFITWYFSLNWWWDPP